MKRDAFAAYIAVMCIFILLCFLAWIDVAYHYFEDSLDMWYMDAPPTLTNFIITYFFWASFAVSTSYIYFIRQSELNSAVKIAQKIINQKI